MNTPETSGSICAETVPHPSMEDTRRHLIALREKHGATSAIGFRCSNIVELIQTPELPALLIRKQMADLQRLLAAQ